MVAFQNSMRGAEIEDATNLAEHLIREFPDQSESITYLRKQPWLKQLSPQKELAMVNRTIEEAICRLLIKSDVPPNLQTSTAKQNATSKCELPTDRALRIAHAQLSHFTDEQWAEFAAKAGEPVEECRKKIWATVFKGNVEG